MEQYWQYLLEKAVHFLPGLALGVFVFLVFWAAGTVCRRVIIRVGYKTLPSPSVINLLGRTAKISIMIIGGVTALGTMGINVSALVAGLGLTGFALGFALKDILSNLVAGVLILTYQPFQPHDRISVSGFEGVVVVIDLRYTTLQAEGKKILIPNSTLFTNSISVIEQ